MAYPFQPSLKEFDFESRYQYKYALRMVSIGGYKLKAIELVTSRVALNRNSLIIIRGRNFANVQAL